jgi:lysozyme
LGFWTIGVGRLIDKRKGGGISKDESDYLLTNDINSRLADLNAKLPWFNTLNDPRKAVLLNMSFQLGMAGLLNFRNTLNKIQDGDFGGAADNMLKSKWAEQTPKRAQEMAEQMRKGKWQSG